MLSDKPRPGPVPTPIVPVMPGLPVSTSCCVRGAKPSIERRNERLHVREIAGLVVLLFELGFHKTAKCRFRFIDVAFVFAELILHHRVIDHFDHRVHPAVFQSQPEIDVHAIERGLCGGNSSEAKDVESGLLPQLSVVFDG